MHYSPVTIEIKVKWENMSLVNIQSALRYIFLVCRM